MQAFNELRHAARPPRQTDRQGPPIIAGHPGPGHAAAPASLAPAAGTMIMGRKKGSELFNLMAWPDWATWVNRLARKLSLDLRIRPRGRPRKTRAALINDSDLLTSFEDDFQNSHALDRFLLEIAPGEYV
jgi:hypothetical protein